MTPVLRNQRQVDFFEFGTDLIYTVSSRTAIVKSCLKENKVRLDHRQLLEI